ncbi:BtrH N-terminal domain-containing protein [Conexibacter sp. DBS9H8]|uniref:BtrH N-terminal domain-containing protein n=1 Tax=Conexibacter sp. DBS9H8 TaxID=2937801 RepID=UPI00200FA8FE|nr:BtrH N-terminal domain-containing protein [Conexibacter sp. DBS9H8]
MTHKSWEPSALDSFEGLDGSFLECWTRAVRDVLYQAGFGEALFAVLQPLDFRISLDRRGVVEWLRGAGDLRSGHCHLGVDATWRAFNDGHQALDLCRAMLEDGRAVPLIPDINRLPESFWFGQNDTRRHALVLTALDGSEAIVSDRRVLPTGLSRVRLDGLQEALNDCYVCDWQVGVPNSPPGRELDGILKASVANLHQDEWLSGVQGILALPDLIAGLMDRSVRIRELVFQRRLATSLLTVEGSRRHLHLVLGSGHPPTTRRCVAEFHLQTSWKAWEALRRVLYLMGWSSDAQVPDALEARVREVHQAELRVRDALGELSSWGY